MLLIDLPNQRVTFRGTEIPTSPPDNLQPQSILALAALAQRAADALTMAEVADGIWKLGGLARRPTSPDQKDRKYKLTNPLKIRPEAVRLVLRDGSGSEKP